MIFCGGCFNVSVISIFIYLFILWQVRNFFPSIYNHLWMHRQKRNEIVEIIQKNCLLYEIMIYTLELYSIFIACLFAYSGKYGKRTRTHLYMQSRCRYSGSVQYRNVVFIVYFCWGIRKNTKTKEKPYLYTKTTKLYIISTVKTCLCWCRLSFALAIYM